MIEIKNKYVYVESKEEIPEDRRYRGGVFNLEHCSFPCWFKREESWDLHFMDDWFPIERNAPEILEAILEEISCRTQQINYLTEAINKTKE